MSISIVEYDADRDEPAVYALWQRCLGDIWPVSLEAFHDKTVGNEAYRPGDHFIARSGGEVVGFIATQARRLDGVPDAEQPRGQVTLVMVDPECRRRGIGRALLERGLERLRARGAREAQLGSGGMAYFWAGVPSNLPDAWAFFQACGWPYAETSFDLVRELHRYATPPEVYSRIRRPHTEISSATSEDVPAILAFEGSHFPRWLRYFQMMVERGGLEEIVLARDTRTGEILGTSFATDFREPSWRTDFVWQELLGADTGGVGPLGVAEEARGNGIGLALAARVTERLKERGLASCFVGYTWLVEWYGKLGYRIWQEHRMSHRSL